MSARYANKLYTGSYPFDKSEILSRLQNYLSTNNVVRLTVPVSSGLDSHLTYVLSCMLLGQENTFPVYLDFGVSYSEAEKSQLQALGYQSNPNFRVLQVTDIYKQSQPTATAPNMPNRNAIVATVLSTLSNPIAFGIPASDYGNARVPDSNDTFLQHTTDYLSYLSGYKMPAISLVKDFTKSDMLFLLNKLKPEDTPQIYSCYQGDTTPCLKCTACFRLQLAKANNWQENSLAEMRKLPSIQSYIKRIDNAHFLKELFHAGL